MNLEYGNEFQMLQSKIDDEILWHGEEYILSLSLSWEGIFFPFVREFTFDMVYQGYKVLIIFHE